MIYMLGGAGYHNFGDELMVRGWLDFLRRYRPGEKIVVDGASKSALTAAFEADYPEVQFTDVVSVVAERTQNRKSFWASFIRGLSFFDRGGFDYHPKEKGEAQAMMQADILHLHGGGYLNAHFPRKGFLMGTAIAVSRRTGAKLIGTGLGVLPMKMPTDEELAVVKGALDQFEFIEARDPEGAALLRELFPTARVIDGVDDTFLAPVAYDPQPGRSLHLSWNEGEQDTASYRRAAEYALAHHADYDQVFFWNCARNDAGVWRELGPKIPGIEELTFQQLLSKPFPVAPGDHMLTARFHPHMIAARGGAVGGFHSPGQYYDVKHGSILKLGSGFFQIEDKPIRPEQFGAVPNTMMARTDDYRVGKIGQAVLFYTETAPPVVANRAKPGKPAAGQTAQPANGQAAAVTTESAAPK